MFLNFLNKPYPHLPSKRSAWITNLWIGCFVALFLLVFQPFSINQWQTPYKTMKILGFGLVSFIVPTFYSWLAFKLVPAGKREDNWRVWKEMVFILSLLLSIALGNLVYSNFLGISEITLMGFLYSTVVTLLLGLFPITLAILNNYQRFLRSNIEEAKLANQHIAQHTAELNPISDQKTKSTVQEANSEKKICLIAENQKDKLEIVEAQLLYVESLDNYSNIVYLENTTLKKQILRTSLKRLESQLAGTGIIRCHRAFLVNLSNVNKVEGNAAGYKLGLSATEFTVPVSRNFASEVMAYLKN